jgi:hypothetical protein
LAVIEGRRKKALRLQGKKKEEGRKELVLK